MEGDADDDETITFEGDIKDDGYYKILDVDPAIGTSQLEECKRMIRSWYQNNKRTDNKSAAAAIIAETAAIRKADNIANINSSGLKHWKQKTATTAVAATTTTTSRVTISRSKNTTTLMLFLVS